MSANNNGITHNAFFKRGQRKEYPDPEMSIGRERGSKFQVYEIKQNFDRKIELALTKEG